MYILSVIGSDCQDIKKKGYSRGDGVYLLDPDGGSDSNAFLAYCDMTSYNGGWTMCYTTVYKAKPKSEVNYVPQLLYGSDGYRTNCNNIAVSWSFSFVQSNLQSLVSDLFYQYFSSQIIIIVETSRRPRPLSTLVI